MLRRSLVLVAALAAVLAPSAVARPHASAFPVTIHAANGDVVVKTRPTRVVSLSPTGTEDLFAVGAGSQVIAVDDQSDYPKNAPHTKLSGFTPNIEAIAGVQPRPRRRLERHRRCRRVARRSSASPSCSSLRPTTSRRRTTRSASSAARPGTRRRRRRSSAGWRRTLTKLIRSVPKAPAAPEGLPRARPDVLLGDVGDVHRPDLQAVRLQEHRRRRRHDALRLSAALGRVHRRGEPGHRRARRLGLLRRRRAATVAARPGWSGIAAVQHHRVIAVDDSVASRWGPRIVDFARAIANVAKKK